MNNSNVLHVSYSDAHGGAAIAALRHHESMRAAGINSTFLCLKKRTNRSDIVGVKSPITKLLNSFVNRINQTVLRLLNVRDIKISKCEP